MTKHILLTEDDALMDRSLSFNLEQVGYRASVAETAENALDLARIKNFFDILNKPITIDHYSRGFDPVGTKKTF